MSFRLNMFGLEGTFGGVRLDNSFEGGDGLCWFVLAFEFEVMELESSSLVNVPWRTIPGFS